MIVRFVLWSIEEDGCKSIMEISEIDLRQFKTERTARENLGRVVETLLSVTHHDAKEMKLEVMKGE